MVSEVSAMFVATITLRLPGLAGAKAASWREADRAAYLGWCTRVKVQGLGHEGWGTRALALTETRDWH